MRNSISNPHYAKPLHIRLAFRIWLTWRNSPILRACVMAIPLGIAACALLIAVLVL